MRKLIDLKIGIDRFRLCISERQMDDQLEDGNREWALPAHYGIQQLIFRNWSHKSAKYLWAERFSAGHIYQLQNAYPSFCSCVPEQQVERRQFSAVYPIPYWLSQIGTNLLIPCVLTADMYECIARGTRGKYSFLQPPRAIAILTSCVLCSDGLWLYCTVLHSLRGAALRVLQPYIYSNSVHEDFLHSTRTIDLF